MLFLTKHTAFGATILWQVYFCFIDNCKTVDNLYNGKPRFWKSCDADVQLWATFSCLLLLPLSIAVLPAGWPWQVLLIELPFSAIPRCKVRADIWFMNVKGIKLTEIHCQSTATYHGLHMYINVRRWYIEFTAGFMKIYDEESHRPSTAIWWYTQKGQQKQWVAWEWEDAVTKYGQQPLKKFTLNISALGIIVLKMNS